MGGSGSTHTRASRDRMRIALLLQPNSEACLKKMDFVRLYSLPDHVGFLEKETKGQLQELLRQAVRSRRSSGMKQTVRSPCSGSVGSRS